MANKEVISQYGSIGKALTQVSRLYYGVVTNKLHSLEIERYYYTILLIKEAGGKLTQKELSEKTCTDKVFVVKVLDYLSEKGMIKRVVNEKDRREHYLTLTPKGEKLVAPIAKAFNDTNDSVFKGLKKEEVDIFFKAIRIMKDNLSVQPADEVKINYKKVVKKFTKKS